MNPTHNTLEEKLRAFSKVAEDTGCWVWQKGCSQKGYGMLVHKGEVWRAHRASYTVFKGEITDGLLVLHTCDMRNCINPMHLYLGTDADNGRDKATRARAAPKAGSLNGGAKLTEEMVAVIKSLKGKVPIRVLANQFCISVSVIKRILRNAAWKHVGDNK